VLQIVASAIETITFVGASISMDWALSKLMVLTLDGIRCGNDISFSSDTFPVLVSLSLCAVAEDANTFSVRAISHTCLKKLNLRDQSSLAFRLITPNLHSLKVQGVAVEGGCLTKLSGLSINNEPGRHQMEACFSYSMLPQMLQRVRYDSVPITFYQYLSPSIKKMQHLSMHKSVHFDYKSGKRLLKTLLVPVAIMAQYLNNVVKLQFLSVDCKALAAEAQEVGNSAIFSALEIVSMDCMTDSPQPLVLTHACSNLEWIRPILRRAPMVCKVECILCSSKETLVMGMESMKADYPSIAFEFIERSIFNKYVCFCPHRLSLTSAECRAR
jgi:hypothetical protein